MKIDGREIAKTIFEDLKNRVEKLKDKNIFPHLVVVLVGEDPASKAYVRQKELKTIEVGAKFTLYKLDNLTTREELLTLVEKLNTDKSVHGIIVQRPLPENIEGNLISEKTNPKKDIDSFHPDSPFSMPLAAAVLKILEEVHKNSSNEAGGVERQEPKLKIFIDWLKSKNIVIIGKGETGGGPTIKMLKDLGAEVKIIDSKTENPVEVAKNADILISAVGRQNIVKPEMLKKGVILISVGLHKGIDGKLHGDYEEDEIKNIASYYTPTPGGVGPVNVAMLVENLIKAAETN